ncbi:MAG: glycyl-radical enzyme activating protein [Chloroflexi bacterium]|nr:glycyl-radical enzyme activating protein [Chloroflexota bacterium]
MRDQPAAQPARGTQLLATPGLIFDLDTFAIHDGPGIRMTVYLKGCLLSCAWCHSPESQAREPQLVFVADRCAFCGSCVAVCPEGAHILADEQHVLNRALCQACGRCVAACAARALQIKGQWVTAGDILRRAVRMRPFFQYSGGGVTLTGGEVTMQPEFAEAVLAGCREQGIHTAIETCGACDWPTLSRLIEHTDLVLYDLKLVDDAAHRRWAGASNRQTLANLACLVEEDRAVQVRVPLIPGITDTEENLGAILRLMGDLGLRSLALLPYNEAAGAKYEWLGRAYTIEGRTQPVDVLRGWQRQAEELGIEATIG